MKKLFWTRIINDPEKKEKTVWKTIMETKVNQKEIEEAFCDNRMAKQENAVSDDNVIKQTKPVIRQYF